VSATVAARRRLPRLTYTVREVADLLGVSERGLRNQIANGAFPRRHRRPG
jgi:Helix-turn-helix domain